MTSTVIEGAKTVTSIEQDKSGGTIEICDDEFDLWLAAQMHDAAVEYLHGQERALAATEARATSILAWTTAGGAALSLKILASGPAPALVGALVPVYIAVICCVATLWPANWYHAGWPPKVIHGWGLTSKAAVRGHSLTAHQNAILENGRRMKRAANMLRLAWLFAASAPIAAILAKVVSRAVSGA